MGIYDQTVADKAGYFVFANRFSPFSPREACLSSKDQFGRISAPACLPPFPTKYNVNIGPVIMPPTVSLDKADYFLSDEVLLTGQTIPDSEVALSFFTDRSLSPFKNVALKGILKAMFLEGRFPGPKIVDAYAIPTVGSKADTEGNFSIQLPSNSAEKYRFFTRAQYQSQFSPNSNTLNMEILPVWMIILKRLLLIWDLIKDRLIEVVIVTELIFILVYLVFFRKHPREIMLYETHLPALFRNDKEIVLKGKN